MRIAVGNEDTWKGISAPKPFIASSVESLDSHITIYFHSVQWDVLRNARLTHYYVLDGAGETVAFQELDGVYKVKRGSIFRLENVSWDTPPPIDSRPVTTTGPALV